MYEHRLGLERCIDRARAAASDALALVEMYGTDELQAFLLDILGALQDASLSVGYIG